MSEVVATAERIVRAPAERVMPPSPTTRTCGPRLLPEQFSDYRVEAGGQGAGTRVAWRFAATSKRGPRPGHRPSPSRRRTPWWRPTRTPRWSPCGRCSRRTPASRPSGCARRWNGAGGIGGFFERTFAPKGLRRVYDRDAGPPRREVAAG